MSAAVKPRKITEDVVLDLSTLTCHVNRSSIVEEKELSWDELLKKCCENDHIYYIDLEPFKSQMQIDNLLNCLKNSDKYEFQFRVNSGRDFDWLTASVCPEEKSGNRITKIRFTAYHQNIFDLNGSNTDNEIIREMLFRGFGRVYSNTIWIDVPADRYIVQNLYGDDWREEMLSKPTGSYTQDNLGYAANFVYPDDRETFNKFTSLEWFRNNLNKEGVKFSFRIRHTCNGEYRWVEVNLVCTKHTAEEFHVLYWLDDVQNESFADADTQNTLMSADIGQWRLELRKDHSAKTLLSSSLQRILGISEEEAADDRLMDKLIERVYPDDINMVRESVQKLAQGEKAAFVFRWEHSTLGLRYYRCGCTCLASSERYTCFCGYGQDITEDMKQISENEARLKAAMLEARKANAAKTAFLSRMSHDIRTPLNGIIGLLDIDEHNDDNIELLKEHRAKAKVAANHLMSLINDVLELNKLDDQNVTLAHEPFSLSEMADEILTIAEMRATESGIKLIHANCAPNIAAPYVYGSPLHVRQIFLNIIGNAIKYNKPGGSVTCRIETVSTDNKTVVYRCTISDTGIGMSKEFLKHIFEPFSQEQHDARSFYQGTGLGMSIVKSLVDRMNGTLEIQSEKGVGSTFTVTIPFEIADSADVADVMEPDGDADIHGVRILLAEDNSLNREIAHTLLEENGAVITEAVDGEQAVNIFEGSAPHTFDVILMDVMMPNMDGLTATRMIRASNRPDAVEIPIIAMTANAFYEDIQRTRHAGMNAHLSKPLDMEKVISVISKFCRKAK